MPRERIASANQGNMPGASKKLLKAQGVLKKEHAMLQFSSSGSEGSATAQRWISQARLLSYAQSLQSCRVPCRRNP